MRALTYQVTIVVPDGFTDAETTKSLDEALGTDAVSDVLAEDHAAFALSPCKLLKARDIDHPNISPDLDDDEYCRLTDAWYDKANEEAVKED